MILWRMRLRQLGCSEVLAAPQIAQIRTCPQLTSTVERKERGKGEGMA